MTGALSSNQITDHCGVQPFPNQSRPQQALTPKLGGMLAPASRTRLTLETAVAANLLAGACVEASRGGGVPAKAGSHGKYMLGSVIGPGMDSRLRENDAC